MDRLRVVRALALVLLVLAGAIAGCFREASPAPASAPEADAQEPGPAAGPGMDVPESDRVNGTYKLIDFDGGPGGGSLAFRLDPPDDAVEDGRYAAALDVILLPNTTATAYGSHLFQLREGSWISLGFDLDGALESQSWEAGVATSDQAPLPAGRRLLPLALGRLSNEETLVFILGNDANGQPVARNTTDGYAVVLSAVGRMQALVRLVPSSELEFSEGGMEYNLGLGCYPSYVQRKGWRTGIYEGCPEAEIPDNPARLVGETWSGFRYGMRYEYTTSAQAFDLSVGDVVVNDLSPAGHRAGSTTRVATYEMPVQFSSGYGVDLAYLIDANSGGNWKADVAVYGSEIHTMGPSAGGPSPILYLAGDLVFGGPLWTCMADGEGPASSRLELNTLGHPGATESIDMLLYARADFGTTVETMLGAPVQGGCFNVGVLYVLDVLGV